MEWNGTRGEKWFIEPVEQGIRIVVVPAEPVVEDGVLDFFGLNLRPSSVREVLSRIAKGQTYTVKDKSARIGKKDGKLFLDIEIQSRPGTFFNTVLEKGDTGSFVKALESFIVHEQPARKDTGKISRNDPCPCGSGKKYKKCCLGKVKEDETDELDFARSIRDEYVQGLIDQASENSHILKESDYWDNLGIMIGSSGDHERAYVAFEKALAIDRNNQLARLNMAVTLNCLDRHQDALRMIDSVSDKVTRKYVIKANILSDIDKYDEAIPLYEKAIKREPDFSLPYSRILMCLSATSNPLYDYWLERSVKLFPKDSWFLFNYASHLVSNGKIEELYEADWMDDVEANEESLDLIGRGLDDKYTLPMTRLWRLCARLHFEPDSEMLHEAVSMLEALSDPDMICEQAKYLTIAAARLSDHEYIKRAYQHIHNGCRTLERGIHPLNVYLAMASYKKGNYEEAVQYCEEFLATNEPTAAALNEYWRALEENEQLEEAINVAEQLLKLDPDFPHLEYNLGYMYEKAGRLGSAKAYYEKQLGRIPDHGLALENMCVISLLEQDFDKSLTFFNACLPHLDRYKIQDYDKIRDEETKSDLAEQIDRIVRKPKQKSFEELLQFARENAGSPSYTVDVIAKLNEVDARIGNYKTNFRAENFDLEQLINGLSNPDDLHAQDMMYQLKTVQRGDRSATVAKLMPRLRNWERLPESTRNSLIEAEYRYLDGQTHDYSPVVVAYAKAVEVAIKKNIFDPFRLSCRVGLDVEQHIKVAMYETDSRLHRLVQFVQRGTHLELGVMVHLLRLSADKMAPGTPLLKNLKDYVENRLGRPGILEKAFLDRCADLATLRNNAAHDATYGKKTASEAREMCFGILPKI